MFLKKVDFVENLYLEVNFFGYECPFM